MSSFDPIADTILALIKAHGMDAVVSAAVRTLPVITFAESNAAVGKYKDMLCDQKNKEAALDRLITNLESENVRLAKEVMKGEMRIAALEAHK